MPESPQVSPAALERSCPRCEYNWTGLPPSGRCPECGLGFDEETRIWSCAQELRPIYWCVLLGGVGLAIAAMVGWMRSWRPFGAGPTMSVLMYMGAAAMYLGLLVFLRAEMKRRRFVAVTADGVEISFGQKCFAISWEDVAGARERMGFATIYARDGTARSISGFKSVEDLEEFLEIVNHRVMLSRGPGS